MREARIYAELTRQAGAGATVEAYERALAEYKTQHADDAAALSEAREAYERALASHRRAALERELDELARRHERLRDAGRDAEAAETAAAMEKLRAEMSRRGARRTHDAAAFEYMLQSMQAELVELQARYAAAGDEARRDELRRSMEIVTRKLRDLEEKMRPGDVR